MKKSEDKYQSIERTKKLKVQSDLSQKNAHADVLPNRPMSIAARIPSIIDMRKKKNDDLI